MFQIYKKKKNGKKTNFFNSSLGDIQFFFIDKNLNLPADLQIYKKKKTLFFQTQLGLLSLILIDSVFVFIQKNKLLVSIKSTKTNKKSILNLYIKLIKLKIKGVLQGYKLSLLLQGIGFRCSVEKNELKLKLGFSHDITIIIPENIKIITNFNRLIFYSIDSIFLHQFVHMVKIIKKPEPYKNKGFLLKNEKLLQKEGKRGKK